MKKDDEVISIAEYEEWYGGLPEPLEFTRDSQWRTKEGRFVRIRNMTDQHLLNTIRVLRDMSPIKTKFKTTPERRRRWLNVMANEAYERGLQIDPLTEEEMLANAKHE